MNARRAEDISSLAVKLYHPTQVTGIVYFEIVDGESSERILTAIRGVPKGRPENTSSGNRGGEDNVVRRLGPSGFYSGFITTAMPAAFSQKALENSGVLVQCPSALFTSEDTECLPLNTLFLRFVLFGLGSYIEMRPCHTIGKFFEERRRRNCACFATADILYVGYIRLDLFRIFLVKW